MKEYHHQTVVLSMKEKNITTKLLSSKWKNITTLKCIIIETRADSVRVKLHGFGLFFPRHVLNDLKKTSWMHNRCKDRAQTVWFDHNGICSSLNNYAFQSTKLLSYQCRNEIEIFTISTCKIKQCMSWY